MTPVLQDTSQNSVRERLRTFLRQDLLVDDLQDEQSFLAHGVVDSLAMVRLISFVESTFGFHVPDADAVVENFDSIAVIAGYVERRLAQSPDR